MTCPGCYGGYTDMRGYLGGFMPAVPFPHLVGPEDISVAPLSIETEIPESVYDVTEGKEACYDPVASSMIKGELYYDWDCLQTNRFAGRPPKGIDPSWRLYWWRLGTFVGYAPQVHDMTKIALAWAWEFLKEAGFIPITSYKSGDEWAYIEIFPSVLFWGPPDLGDAMSAIDKATASRAARDTAEAVVAGEIATDMQVIQVSPEGAKLSCGAKVALGVAGGVLLGVGGLALWALLGE